MGVVLLTVLVVILIMLVIITYEMHSVERQHAADETADEENVHEKKKNILAGSQTFLYAAIVLTAISIVAALYFILKGTVWEGHLTEWLNIAVRLMHITFGIAWIGASFYFVFLENALNRTNNVRDELAGNLWAIHGGGFYYLEKYKTAPKNIPKQLHWFKYEAYFTWLSGFCLLFVVYYFNAPAMLIDKAVADISPLKAIGIGVISFIVAWIIYDLLCKTALIKKGIWFTLAGFIIAIGFAWFYSHVFSGRAAYIHFGAMLGTLMAGNVFFVIIPAQKAMVKAAREGKLPDPQLGKNTGLRSLHNNYFTLPVLFVMISNHFPSTFGNAYPWLILIIISLGAAGVKHYLNLREKGQLSVWVMPVSVLILLSAAYLTAPGRPRACKARVSFTEVNSIIQERCISCHSGKPSDDVYTAAPNGVMYDTPDDIIKYKDKIMQRVVVTKTMPPRKQNKYYAKRA